MARMQHPLIEIRIGEPIDGELPIEVWRTVRKDPEGGSTSQQVVTISVPIEIPIKE